uniref:Putative sec1 family domain-containing protein 2 n=1 Tax=Ixodes ricinus TaxID=34613 RepID=A0A6B0VER6_IXORI
MQNLNKPLLDDLAKELWTEEVLPRAKDAVVFLDNPMAEALHWHGGAPRLFEAGALAVREFCFFERGSASEPKALFLVSSPVAERTLSTLSSVVRASVFTSCCVITSCPPAAQRLARYGSAEGPGGPQAFLDAEEQLLDWMGNPNLTAEVMYVPLSVVNITSKFFVMPQFCHVFPPLQEHFNTNQGPLLEFGALPREMQIDLKGAESRVSLVLVDRTLDMAGPLTSSCESLLDRLVRVLPTWPGHNLDVCVDMRCLCSSPSVEEDVPSAAAVYPGCLAHEDSRLAMHHLVSTKHKECLMELNRLLVDVALKQGVRLDVSGRLTPELLKKRVLQLRRDGGDAALWLGLVQQVLGVTQAMLSPSYARLEELLSTEKVLVQNAAVSGDAASRSLVQLLRSRKTTGLRLEDILVLLTLLYSLLGDRTLGGAAERRTLKQTNLGVSGHLTTSSNEKGLDENEVIQAVDQMLSTLRSLGLAKDQLKKYRAILEDGDPMQPAVYKPLLKQLLQDIFDPDAKELPHLDHHSGGLGDMLKTGFGFFKSTTKPLPKDNPTLIVFIIGGVTASEVKLVADFVSSRKLSKQVIVGSTSLARPSEQLGLLFKRDLAHTSDLLERL